MPDGESSDWKKAIVERLLDNSPLVLVILGLCTLLIGLADGLTLGKLDYKIQDKTRSTVAAATGGGVLIAGIVLLVLLRTRARVGDAKRYAIKINHPQHNAVVNGRCDVRGTFTKKPPEDWDAVVLEFSPTNSNYYFKRDVFFNERTREWSAVDFGIGGNKEDERHLFVVLPGPAGQALRKYYERVVTRTQEEHGKPSYIGFPKLTPDTLVCDQRVVRKGGA